MCECWLSSAVTVLVWELFIGCCCCCSLMGRLQSQVVTVVYCCRFDPEIQWYSNIQICGPRHLQCWRHLTGERGGGGGETYFVILLGTPRISVCVNNLIFSIIIILKTFIDIQIRIDIRNIRIDIRKCQSGENFGVLLTDQIYLDIHSGKDGKIWGKCREKDE